MIDILRKIVGVKRSEVEYRKKIKPVAELMRSGEFDRSCVSLRNRLNESSNPGIIAEFKRRSPTIKAINLEADLEPVLRSYEEAGASGLSILTDNEFFGGSDEYIQRARSVVPEMPILRKEFIIDPYQIYESKALGADVVLLISEILSVEEVHAFGELAISMGMEVLLELHDEDQIEKTKGSLSIIGINNRDLRTFKVDYERSIAMLSKLRSDVPRISESGLSNPDTVAMLSNKGFDGFLIGEYFMKHKDPGRACRKFIASVCKKR